MRPVKKSPPPIDHLDSVPAIAIATYPRNTNYIQETVRSAWEQDPEFFKACPKVTISVGCEDFSQVTDEIRAMPHVEVLTSQTRLHAPENILKCLKFGAVKDRPLILLEDDMKLAPNWLKVLTVLWRSHFAPYFDKYVISGYTPYSFLPTRKVGFVEYGAPFYASCCLLISQASLPVMAEALRANSAATRPMPADLALGQCMQSKKSGIKLYSTVPSLAQHVGDDSALGTKAIRRAPTFGTPSLG